MGSGNAPASGPTFLSAATWNGPAFVGSASGNLVPVQLLIGNVTTSLLSPVDSSAVDVVSPPGLVDGSAPVELPLDSSPVPDGCSAGPLDESLGSGMVVPPVLVVEVLLGFDVVEGPPVFVGVVEDGPVGPGVGVLGAVVVEDGSGGGVLLLDEAEQPAVVMSNPVSKTVVRIKAPLASAARTPQLPQCGDGNDSVS